MKKKEKIQGKLNLTLIRAAIQIEVVVRLEVIYDFQATNRREGGDTS